MNKLFADRVTDVPRSFIREILKDALQPGTISFAGGLPNRELFPIDGIQDATNKVFETIGKDVLQYSNSEGYLPLREYIAQQYAQQGLSIPVESILITSGSQQGLDLLGKTLINDNDGLIIEEPGYLGAIQAFSLYRPRFLPIPVNAEGMDLDKLKYAVAHEQPKLIYTVPNFQNPSGITYPNANRQLIADTVKGTDCFLIEDNPYGDLRFEGDTQTSFKALMPDNTILLGSFSKTVVPGFRIGWIVAPDDLMEKLIIAKQASDLHTNQLSQCIIHQYLTDCDLNKHIETIIKSYGNQKNTMIQCLEKYFPKEVSFTRPEGGMFLWATLPKNISALDLFQLAAKEKVLFVPGDPFYINKTGVNTLRLNYSCVDEETIEIGIKRLAHSIRELLKKNN
ncbi:MAG: PLP-dependent aminotransferase family protein [Cellvibrionaceae bacterium]